MFGAPALLLTSCFWSGLMGSKELQDSQLWDHCLLKTLLAHKFILVFGIIIFIS